MAIPFPHLSESDPDTLGEGKLDPLGLAPLADRLAERIAPQMTARMSRPRFVTAMAVGSAVVERLWDEVAADGTTPELAFEWLLVEGFGWNTDLPQSATAGVPGITKARLAIRTGRRMTAPGYLKTPTVFGFNGVYAPLARGINVVDHSLVLAEHGFELVEVWEADTRMKGLLSGQSGSPGARLRSYFEDKVRRSLDSGRACGSYARSADLAGLMRPDGARKRERRLLWNWIASDDQPTRAEAVERLRRVDRSDSEAWALRAVRSQAGLSREFARALDAIDSYEKAVRLALTLLDVLRYECWVGGSRPTDFSKLAANDVLTEVSTRLPRALREAEKRLERVELGAELHRALGTFAEPMSPAELLRCCLDRHTQVQAAKPPSGKRSWFEESNAGLRVRLGYELSDRPELPDGEYWHPYRVGAMLSFIEDLS